MAGPSDLESLIRAYAPDGDTASHAIALGVLDTGRQMWRRSEFYPGHFTASGFVASPDRAALLLIHHARLGAWLQPGGHIERSDASVEDAARREVEEETGLGDLDRVGKGLLRIDAHPIPANADEPAHVHIDLAIGFVSRTDAIGPIAEVLDARWVGFDDLGDYDVDGAVHAAAGTLRDRVTAM